MFYNYSDFDSLDEKDVEKNNQMAFDVAEKEFGISPIMTGKEMSSVVEPDKLSMVMYLSQFYEMFKDTVPPGGELLLYNFASRENCKTKKECCDIMLIIMLLPSMQFLDVL